MITHNPAHQLWAMYAAMGYAASAMALVARPSLPGAADARPAAVVGGRVAGDGHHGDTAGAPGRRRHRESGDADPAHGRGSLAERWHPFPTEADLASRGMDVNAYNVYLPLPAVFGRPSATFGRSPITDPRSYLTLVSFTIFLLLGRRAS
ncbi:MAG TPA: hypothetical protein VGO16_02855 [Pseudonocardiaceae bacterium]|nr:hypothetical protein [Pseudonocardiaceae bacterium]